MESKQTGNGDPATRPAATVSREEWERRFKAHIVESCRPPAWSATQARHAADEEFGAVDFLDLYEGFEDDPEGAADEAMSYWEDDGDDGE